MCIPTVFPARRGYYPYTTCFCMKLQLFRKFRFPPDFIPGMQVNFLRKLYPGHLTNVQKARI